MSYRRKKSEFYDKKKTDFSQYSDGNYISETKPFRVVGKNNNNNDNASEKDSDGKKEKMIPPYKAIGAAISSAERFRRRMNFGRVKKQQNERNLGTEQTEDVDNEKIEDNNKNYERRDDGRREYDRRDDDRKDDDRRYDESKDDAYVSESRNAAKLH